VRIGEKARLAVRLRNVGKAEVTVSAWPLWYHSPRVFDADGKMVRATRPPEPSFEIIPTKHTLKPGQTVDLDRTDVAVEADDGKPAGGVVERFMIRVRPGTYRARFAGFLQDHPTLSTGTTEFEVKEAAADNEAVPAWGKEVGGLQAGLSVGDERTYRHGETVTLVVRIRNVGKEAVNFEYVKQYLDENPPTVTDADGKTIPQGNSGVTGVIHVPVEVSLDPGKEVVLESRIHGASGLRYELHPVSGGGKESPRSWPLLVGTGKVTLQYERVFGSSSIGRLELDPAPSTLGTGKLELEVEPAPGK
jgi:hypothetical protein